MKMHKPTHPGEILRELYLSPLNLSVTDASQALGVSRKTLSELLNGKSGISTTMSLRLSKAFNTTPELWLNLQQNYDLWQGRKKVRLSRVKVLV
jgi:addiction module HigA family antidote